MKKFKIEFKTEAIQKWSTRNELMAVEASTAEQAAIMAADLDGLENAMFRVWELAPNEFGVLEPFGTPQFINFGEETKKSVPDLENLDLRKVSVAGYFDTMAVYGYGQCMGDLYILCTGTEAECLQYIQDHDLGYMLEEDE